MGAVSYTIKTFNPEEAASGALCIVTSKEITEGSSINPDATWDEGEAPNTTTHKTVVGTGICKRRGDLFTITINSTNYTFNIDGTGYSGTARGKYLYRCEVVDSTIVTNNVVSTTKKITRGDNGAISTETLTTAANILIENLTARDEFAAQALRGILGRIDNPSVLSKDELKFYCDAAYKWAEGMLQEAAKSRAVGSITTVSGTSTSSYSDNTEALLAQIAAAIGNISISGGSGEDTPGTVDLSGVETAINQLKAVVSASPYGALGEYLYNMSGDKVRGIFLKNSERKTSAEGVTPETFEKVPLEVHSEGVMTVKNETVTEGNTTFTNPLSIDGSTTTKIVDDNYNTLGTSSDPITVKLNSSAQIRVDNVNSNGLKVSEQNEDRTVSFASGASVGVSGTLALENAEDSNNDPKPIIVEGTGTTVVQNDVDGSNPIPFLVSTSTDLQDELSDIKESIDNLIDWEKAYEVGTAAISTTAGLFNLRPLPDNILKMRIRIYDGNGDKVNITPDTLATYQWFNNENAVTDLSDSIYFKDIISALRDEPSETVTHLQIGSQGINSTYATPIKIVVDYVYGNTGSNSTNRTISGELSIKNSSTTDGNDTVTVPLEVNASVTGVDNIPWVLYRKTQYNTTLSCFIMPTVNGEPTIADPKYLKLEIVRVIQGQITKVDSDAECTVNMYDGNGNAAQNSDVSYPLNYIPYLIRSTAIGPDLMTLRIKSVNGFTLDGNYTLYAYAAGNIGTSGGGSASTNREVSFASGATLNVSMPGYLPLSDVGVQNGKVLRLVEFPNYDAIRENQNYNQDYAGVASNVWPDEPYFKGLVRWAIATYPGIAPGDGTQITLMGSARPNSSGTAIIELYSTSGYDNTSKLPRYCSGTYRTLSGQLVLFGTDNYTWYWNIITPSDIATQTWVQNTAKAHEAVSADSATYASRLQGSNSGTTNSAPSAYSLNYTYARVYSERVEGTSTAGGSSDSVEQRLTFVPAGGYVNGQHPVQLSLSESGVFFRTPSTASSWNSWNKIWHSGNDGSGSGLDADTVDGIEGSALLQKSAINIVQTISGGDPNTTLGNIQAIKMPFTINEGVELTPAFLPLSGGTVTGSLNVSNEITSRKLILAGDSTLAAPHMSIAYNYHSAGRYILNFEGLVGTTPSASPPLYYNFDAGITSPQVNTETNVVLNSNATNGVYMSWNSSGYFNFHGDTASPRGYVFDAPVTQSSDIRMKDIIRDEAFDAESIAKMPLVTYSWKKDEEKREHFGTIAQNWEKVIPEVVSEAPDGMKAMDYGAAAMAAGVTACREIVALKEENKELKKTVEYLKKELEAIKEIVYGKKENDMED